METRYMGLRSPGSGPSTPLILMTKVSLFLFSSSQSYLLASPTRLQALYGRRCYDIIDSPRLRECHRRSGVRHETEAYQGAHADLDAGGTPIQPKRNRRRSYFTAPLAVHEVRCFPHVGSRTWAHRIDTDMPVARTHVSKRIAIS